MAKSFGKNKESINKEGPGEKLRRLEKGELPEGEKRPEIEAVLQLEQMQTLIQTLEELKKQNEQLKQELEELKRENQKLQEENKALREKETLRSNVETRAFVDFWVNYLINTDYLISRLAMPGYSFATMDRGALIWRLPDMVWSRMSAAYGGNYDPSLAHLVYRGLMDRILSVDYQPQVPAGYPPVPNISNIIAGRDFNIGNIYGAGGLPQAEQRVGQAFESGQQPREEAEAPAEEAAEEQPVESEQAPEPEAESAEPEDSAVAGALEQLINKYSLEDGRGRIRGGVLPIAGAVGGGMTFSTAMGLAGLSGPIIGAASVGLGSLAGSGIRRMAGENSFNLWARYSHVEKEKGIWGGIKTAFRYFARGLERQTMKKIIGLEGRSKKIQELEHWADTAVPTAVMQRLRANPEELRHYIAEALWYVTAVNTVQQSGGYLHEDERTDWNARALKMSEIADTIFRSAGYNLGQDNAAEFLEEVVKEIEQKEKNKYGWQISAMAGLGAAKAFVGATIIGSIKEVISNISSAGPASTPPSSGPVPSGPGIPPVPVAETVNPGGDSFGHVFERVTGLSADHLWSDFHGEAVLDKFFSANTGNHEYWRYLAGLAKGGYLDNLSEVSKIGEILKKIGVDAATGDFSPDAGALANLSHQDQLTLVRYVGYPGWAQKILGHPLGLGFPDKSEFISAIPTP
ncbi:MAG: cell division protein ZapB [Patescibacteria group bacterium]